MQPISICVISKNEEKHMDTFLSRIVQYTTGYPVEIILADTGSTDATKEIASRYPVKIFDFPWINDFSAARNFSVSQASNDWILILDCDEYLEEFDMETVQRFMLAYPDHVGLICIRSHFISPEKVVEDPISNDYIGRFYNRQRYHFESIVHEQLFRNDGVSPEYDILPITVDHKGYAGTTEELLPKTERNGALLLKMLEQNPNDPYIYFQLGQNANMRQDYELANYYYGKGLEFNVNPQLSYVKMMVTAYGYTLIELQRYEEALLLENIYEDFSDDADFVFLMGLVYLRNGNYIKAMAEFLKATTFPTAKVTGVNSFLAQYNMGIINEALGNKEAAIAIYKKCGDYPQAIARIQELSKEGNDTPENP